MKLNSFLGHFTVNVILSCSVFGQSSFLFRNYGTGINAPVLDAQGIPLAGPNYLAELWGGVASNSLEPLILIDQGGTRLIKPFANSGYVVPSDGGTLAVTSVPAGGWAWLQMRAWDARLGGTYEAVAALGIGGYGESSLFYAQGGYPFDQFPEPGRLIGLQSFSLSPVVPEPSTWVLLTLGGTAVWLAARRKRQQKREP